MAVPIASLYAAMLIAVAFVLTWRVIKGRELAKVSLGDGENELLKRRIRAHGNFVETAPLILIGLLILELNDAPALWLHVMGAATVVSRIGHAIGMAYIYPNIPFRLVSTAITGIIFGCLVLSMVALQFLSSA